jgi:hypothetical protein
MVTIFQFHFFNLFQSSNIFSLLPPYPTFTLRFGSLPPFSSTTSSSSKPYTLGHHRAQHPQALFRPASHVHNNPGRSNIKLFGWIGLDWVHTGGKCRIHGQDSKRRTFRSRWDLALGLQGCFGRPHGWWYDLEEFHSHIKVLEDRQSMVLLY